MTKEIEKQIHSSTGKSREKPTSSPHKKNLLKSKMEKIDNKAHKTEEVTDPTGEKRKA